ncbi:phosphatase PAP2 family protein [Afifella aestuarii]|uniref:phosphatase PAP2 family protein n=1 Tax=Afifella aestuarii TaxID=1909496 RepID=UPI000FE3AC5D|nr:phosphatase PAP2 family protein [Afifella aestuarii]
MSDFKDRWSLTARQHLVRGRERALAFSRLLNERQRDRRHPPYRPTPIGFLNGVVLIGSVLVVLFILADPYLTLFQATMQPEVRDFLEFVTDIGKSDWMLIATGGFLIYQIFRDISVHGIRRRAAVVRASATATYLFVSVLAAGLIVVVLKYVIGRARPKLFDTEGLAAFHPFSFDPSWASFPSGHATNVAALGVALALLFPRARIVILTGAFWIAVSRLATRSHYPTDVVAGFLLGGAVAWLTARIFAERRLVFRLDAAGRIERRHVHQKGTS